MNLRRDEPLAAGPPRWACSFALGCLWLASTAFAGLALIIAGVWVVNGGGLWLAERVLRSGRGVDAARLAGGSEDDTSRRRTPS